MTFIAMAIGVCLVQRATFRDPVLVKRPVEMKGKILAFASILCWMGAITAGRLLAYVGPGVVSSGGR